MTNIEYDFQGQQMVGHLAYDDNRAGKQPAVLLAPSGFGIDDNLKSRAERLAALGYVAFAIDIYGEGKTVTVFEEALERLEVLEADPDLNRSLAFAGLEVLLAHPKVDPDRVAAIGFCFGGTMVLELGRAGADLKAIVGFHPGLATRRPDDAKHIKARVLICVGADEPVVSLDERIGFEKEMADGGVEDWCLEVYGGGVGHGFTNPAADGLGVQGIAYHELADARSWQSMLRLFAETIDA